MNRSVASGPVRHSRSTSVVVDVEQRATARVVVRRVHEDVDRAELRDDVFDRGVDLVG